MAQVYDSATDRMVLLENEPLNLRTFELVLIDANQLATKRVTFDGTHTALSDVVGGEDFAENATRVALRTQLIPKPLDPTSSTSTAPKILQFFAQDPNNNTLVERRNSGLILERVGEGDALEDTLLYLLNPDEVNNLAHGDGFAAEVQVSESLVSAGAARKRSK